MARAPASAAKRQALAFVLLGALAATGCSRQSEKNIAPSNAVPRWMSAEDAARLAQLEAHEKAIEEAVWQPETAADRCGALVDAFWDSVNAATNKLAAAQNFPCDAVVLGDWSSSRQLRQGVVSREPSGSKVQLRAEDWRTKLREAERAGWQLETLEFRHTRCLLDPKGQPQQSLYSFRAHLTNGLHAARAQIAGELTLDWQDSVSPSGDAKMEIDRTAVQPHAPAPWIKRVDASQLQIVTREGEPPFQLVLQESISPVRNSRSIDPLLVYDLDGDGLSEIILAAKNVVYQQTPQGTFATHALCEHPPGPVQAAVLADFDGDGIADYLCSVWEGLLLFQGAPNGTFPSPGRLVWHAGADVKYPIALTGGDIDRDGDLDLFLAQYKLPYDGGQMPTPYYDANDGYPAYLLRNDGQGNFSDATLSAALGKKRWRRSFSSSFADLDGDGHLDLVVVSDFAGVDFFRNDRHGRFIDVTDEWAPERHAFGMGHALSDFNSDGLLDCLATGMTSATADRLEHFGLWRPDPGEDKQMRSRMTHGNRFYLGRGQGRFDEQSEQAALANSGWSWGCSAADFDNDGWPDLYVANGMETRNSVRDYEREIWLHDAYAGTSKEDTAVHAYLRGKYARLRARGESYGGYEKNRLFFNLHGQRFEERAHLFGVALEFDSRNVVANDLDGDGRADLVLTHFEKWPGKGETLRVYRNAIEDTGNWIGFRFREEGGGKSPVGVQVLIEYEGRRAVRQIVTGDSYRSQHPASVHFGLGKARRVERVEIRWIHGEKLEIKEPALNRYHSVRLAPKL